MSSKSSISFGFKSAKQSKEKLQTQISQEAQHVAEYVSSTEELSSRYPPWLSSYHRLKQPVKQQVVIPMIAETWKGKEPQGTVGLLSPTLEVPALEHGAENGSKSSADMSIDEQAAQALVHDSSACLQLSIAGKTVRERRKEMPAPILIRNRVPGAEGFTTELEKFRHDVDLRFHWTHNNCSRPDEVGFDAYDRVSVDDFGKGMLLGMGWVPGQGIGKTNQVRLGLGADPAMLPSKKQKKYIKPGESREGKPLERVAPGPDGRVRHFKRMSDRLIPVHSMQLRTGALVEILVGKHSSLYGRIVDFKAIDETKIDSICSVRLQINEEVRLFCSLRSQVVSVNHSELQILDEHALPKDHPALWSSEELHKRRQADVDMLAPVLNGKENKKRPKSPTEEIRPEKKHKNKRSRSREPRPPKRITWVVPHIRVRVINKRLGGGKFYNQKGRVEDVISVSQFTVIMDANRQLIEELEEKDVETALPKVGGNVLVVKGAHKGEVGKLLERNAETSVAAVQLEAELEVIKSSFDDIAEHVPS